MCQINFENIRKTVKHIESNEAYLLPPHPIILDLTKKRRGSQKMTNQFSRGAIFYADLPNVGGNVINGMRPVVIIQNNTRNSQSPTTLVMPLTSRNKKPMPTHIKLKQGQGLDRDSTILAEQVICINKSQLGRFVTRLPESVMQHVDSALALSIGLFGKLRHSPEMRVAS
jgi:mRNA interferase MazF